MKAAQRRAAVFLGLFLLACFGMFLYVFHLAGGQIIPGQHGYRVEVVVPDAYGLAQGGDVRTAGVQIGRVTNSRNLGATTVLMLDLQRSHSPIYHDATVLIRTKSIAGENYLELRPGTPQAGAIPDGGTLQVNRAEEATQLDQVLSELDPHRRRQLQRALAGLGTGLARHGGDLNNLFQTSAGALAAAAPVTATLAADRAQLAGLVDNFGRVTRALGDRAQAIQLLVRQAKVTAAAVDARNGELDQALRLLPGFLAQTRTTAARLQGFAPRATPVVRDLRLAVADLAPAVVDLRSAAPAGRRVVRALLPFADAVKPVAAQLKPFSTGTSSAIPSLAAILRQGNPLLGYLSPYWQELPVFFAEIGAATKYTDSIGHLGRLALIFGLGSIPGVLPGNVQSLVQKLNQAAGGLDTLGFNGYPAPGAAGQSSAFTGSYPQLQPDPPYAPKR